MTCVVSYVDKKKRTMWMAADTLCSDGYIGYDRKEPKIFETGSYLIGFAGNPRYMQILKYANGFPIPMGDLHRFMCLEFSAHVAKICDDMGHLKKKEEILKVPGYSTLHILVGGRSFSMYSDFQIEETAYPYAAIGSGTEVAMGALYAQPELLRKDPKAALSIAISAAKTFVTSVGGKTKIISKEY